MASCRQDNQSKLCQVHSVATPLPLMSVDVFVCILSHSAVKLRRVIFCQQVINPDHKRHAV